MTVHLKEVQHFGLVSMFIGFGVFLFIGFWDGIAGIHVNHNQGYGWMQVLGMASSGIYSLWAYSIHLKWKEYIKHIHGCGK